MWHRQVSVNWSHRPLEFHRNNIPNTSLEPLGLFSKEIQKKWLNLCPPWHRSSQVSTNQMSLILSHHILRRRPWMNLIIWLFYRLLIWQDIAEFRSMIRSDAKFLVNLGSTQFKPCWWLESKLTPTRSTISKKINNHYQSKLLRHRLSIKISQSPIK